MNNKMKRFFMKYATGFFSLIVFVTVLGEEMCLGSNVLADERVEELMNQGYSWEVAADQAAEEFYGKNGLYGTGGIDGKLLHESKSEKTTCKHEYTSEITKEPTCTEEGVMTYTCTKCGKTYTEKIAKLEHDYQLVETTETDCQTKAVETYKCTVCGDTITKEGAFGEHNFVKSEDSKEPTCTEDGYYKSVCSVCGEVKEDAVSALGHQFSVTKEIIKEPTCTKDGLKAYVCSVCGATKEEEVIKAIGHEKNEEMEVVTDATFFKDGVGQYICKNCSEVLETVAIPAKGGIWRFFLPIIGIIIISATTTLLIVKRKKSNSI